MSNVDYNAPVPLQPKISCHPEYIRSIPGVFKLIEIVCDVLALILGGVEMFWCAFIALLYLIASIIVATLAKYHGVYGAAAFFGFAAFITYVFDGLNNFRMYRFGTTVERNYGNTTVTQQTTTTTRQETY
ncbi:unnamed protein product [Didymodactylos carnosus]|uniref:MARVEL domain-containing protein n=1 Tax=Didymodactylos carnosus TaxID=1234261 RepID=A0A813RF39_9BILA|nr:unnamed protein product [Didymodactylos carnosus]CAF3566945.1 unnamed protein product [Didymodactylos carnosus]